MTLESEQAENEAKVKSEQAKLETKLKTERTNLRRHFTISANVFDEIHRKIDIEKDIYVQILHGTFKQVTLQIFTDASAIGYACCAFLRCEEEDEVKVSLVSAKARVAPVQRPTIPRLELLGAAIGARIASTILETLNSPLKSYFWTDSMTVLGWITNSEPWNTFVGNRVREIRELTNVED
ncbi:uncharacterized protein TNCT_366471 [Trichonephila clavata]|uniref:Uncharacterized protein n=1 Tax=Trichonephila clavata TaxID=2740835 RepID=A0A8X6HPS3_TRICU|nr:uncharacterized protein TNCT_366471 [Trichonephila clavata]